MNDILPIDISSLPSLDGAEASLTELGWTYTYERQAMLDGMLRSSVYDPMVREALEQVIADTALDYESFTGLYVQLLNNQMGRVSHMGDLSSMKEINRFLKGKVRE